MNKEGILNDHKIIRVYISLSGLLWQSTTNWVAYATEIHHLPDLQCRSLRSRSQQGQFFPRAVRKHLLHASLLSSGLLAIFSHPWLVDASPFIFTGCSTPMNVCIQISPFYKDMGHIRLEPILMTFSSLDHLQKPSFQIRLHSEAVKVNTLTDEFWGDIIQSITGYFQSHHVY